MTDSPIHITEPVGLSSGVAESTRQVTEPRKSRRITVPVNTLSSTYTRRSSDAVVHVGHPVPQRRQTYSGRPTGYDDLRDVQVSMPDDSPSEDDVTSVSSEKAWRTVGTVTDLVRFHCQRLYSNGGGLKDLGLFYNRGTFYAMDAWCGHMGGPLFEGDIEDLNGRSHVMCPWHSYMFDLETGKNNLGMEQEIHKVKQEGGLVYVLYGTELSTTPFDRNASE